MCRDSRSDVNLGKVVVVCRRCSWSLQGGQRFAGIQHLEYAEAAEVGVQGHDGVDVVLTHWRG